MEQRDRTRLGLAALAVGVVVIAATTTFFLGKRAGVERAAAAEAEAADAAEALDTAVGDHARREAELRHQIEGLSHQMALLNAHVALARSVLHLDDRNFGLSETARRESVAFLRGAGALSGPWPDLRKRLEGIEVRVAEDLQAQRATLRAVLADMNGAAGQGASEGP